MNDYFFFFSLYKFHRKPAHSNLKELPGISIIKPLTGIDTNLYENLKTFFNLHYPRVCQMTYMIVFPWNISLSFSMKFSFAYKKMTMN